MADKVIQGETKLKIGDIAPEFALPAQDGKKIRLSDYKGKKNVMLAFYPQDFTPVCSHQLPSYSKQVEKFEKLNTQVLAIGVASIPVHIAWIDSLGGLDYPLLADWVPYAEVSKKYDAFIPRIGFGKRAIFIIDKQGIIRYIDIPHELNQGPPDEDKIFKALEELQD
ncbi:MAG: redoxin domain-containing protein [Candidatus Heimdallarchaeota archaeon]|nr:MAG: redoxin domain-containing protein [Candidatus Heimdallarchaeota archaeon]